MPFSFFDIPPYTKYAVSFLLHPSCSAALQSVALEKGVMCGQFSIRNIQVFRDAPRLLLTMINFFQLETTYIRNMSMEISFNFARLGI